MSIATTHETRWAQPGLKTRTGALLYGVGSYAVGMTALAWLVASLARLVPFGLGPLSASTTAGALGINASLLVLFAVQHSAMARKRFKNWWTQFIPEAVERSTYVLASGLALGLVVWLWQPMDGLVWSMSSPGLRALMWSLFAFGWSYLVVSTFATNHFDLFGLRQAWMYFRCQPYRPIPFTRRWMYRFSRHPMMAGVFIGLWATPIMQVDHLLLAVGLSAYIAVGIAFEERALTRHFGETYRQYRREVGRFLPRLRA